MRISVLVSLVAVSIAAASCADERQDPDSSTIQPYVPGTPLPEPQAEQKQLQTLLDEVRDLSAEAFTHKYAVAFSTGLGYSPLAARGIEQVQASALALDAKERAGLERLGFVISEHQRFPSFVYGYKSIYAEDLPLFISADSILYAVHESYDSILQRLEQAALIPALGRMLGSMRAALSAGAAGDLSPEARADADLYLSVAASLLTGEFLPPVATGDAAQAQQLFDGAVAASGSQTVLLFDVPRDVDFSQFKPRGHYVYGELARYFRAMMWLGRVELRIIETQSDQSQVFHRRQLEAAYTLRALMNDAAVSDWKSVDHTIESFVGEPDNMTLPQLDDLLCDLDLDSAAGLAERSDEAIVQAIVNGGYGAQRISSQIMVHGLAYGTLPLSRTFLLFGQRYVIDSHVFSNVVYDRVQNGTVLRMLPDPLDVAFAAFDNNQAGQLLFAQLVDWGYAPDLASMRILANAHPPAFWQANLYNAWLHVLRALSPGRETADPVAAGMPAVTGTEAWGRRLLQTQLASWAELRHDTILYAKPSYSGGGTCEYPDAYVEPYPELYARLGAFASKGAALVATLDLSANPLVSEGVTTYFAKLGSVASTLEAMARDQRTGAPHSAEHLAFVNRAVSIGDSCGSLSMSGWYADLFFDGSSAIGLNPTIADVHTDPNEGRVLHIATGMPRAIVVTAEGCTGPRAYVGVVSSYFERITENFERLDDQQWSAEIVQATPADVPWVTDFVLR